MAKSRGPEVAPSTGKYVEPIDRKGGWDDYDIRNFLRTLSEAEKIKKNAPLMRALRAEAKKQLQALQTTANTLGK